MKYTDVGLTCMLLIATLTIGSLGYGTPGRQDTVTRYCSISPTAFVPYRDLDLYTKTGNTLGLRGSPGVEPFFAAVYLPDSAQVVEFKAWVRDDVGGTMAIDVSLRRWSNNSLSGDIMAEANSIPGAGSQELTDSTIDFDLIDNSSYKYHVEAFLREISGHHTLYGMRIKYTVIEGGTRVEETSEFVNTSSAVPVVHPTPFVHQTAIDYTVPKREKVSIKIYDEVGRLVRTMIDSTMDAGSYTARWDGTDENGKRLPNGPYFCIIKTNGSSATKVVHID